MTTLNPLFSPLTPMDWPDDEAMAVCRNQLQDTSPNFAYFSTTLEPPPLNIPYYLRNAPSNTETENTTSSRRLTEDERHQILACALQWCKKTNISYQYGSMDCSHLVAKIYAQAGFAYEYTSTQSEEWAERGFVDCYPIDVQCGDLIFWAGHVGIVVDPDEYTFIAISSGDTAQPIKVQSYAPGSYWGKQAHSFKQYQTQS